MMILQDLNNISNQELLDLYKIINDFLKYLETEQKNIEKIGEEDAK